MSKLFRHPDGMPMRTMTIKEFCRCIGIGHSSYYRLPVKPKSDWTGEGSQKQSRFFGPMRLHTRKSCIRIFRKDALAWVATHKPDLLENMK